MSFKLTAFDDLYPLRLSTGDTILGGSNGSNSAVSGGDVVGDPGDLTVIGLRQRVSLSSNMGDNTLGTVLTTIQSSPWLAAFAVSSNTGGASFGSNATHVAEISAPGASTDSARMDHYHAGVAQITSSSSNTLQRGTVNLRAGANIAFGLTDTDGDGEFDTLSVSAVASGGGSVGNMSAAILSPLLDTYIDSQSATTNNVSGTSLQIGNKWGSASFTRFSLMQFDISNLGGRSIVSAMLYMYRTDATNSETGTTGGNVIRRHEARRILRTDVNLSQATWNVYKTGSNWTTAGARSVGNDIAAVHVGGTTPTGDTEDADMWYWVDIAKLIRDALTAGETTLSIIVGNKEDGNGSNVMSFASNDNATVSIRPTLHVNYF